MPQPWLGRVVAEANDLQDDYELVRHARWPSTCAHATDRRPARVDGRAALRGPRQPAHGRGVEPRRRASRRRRAPSGRSSGWPSRCRRCSCPPSAGRRALLDEAWLEVIRNAAHDSICACSVDEVCDAVLHRYAEATQIGEGLAQRARSPRSARSIHGRRSGGRQPVGPRPAAASSSSSLPGQRASVPARRCSTCVRPSASSPSSTWSTMAAVVVRELKHNASIQAIALESVDTGEVLWRAERERDGALLAARRPRRARRARGVGRPGMVRIRIRSAAHRRSCSCARRGMRRLTAGGRGQPAPLDVARSSSADGTLSTTALSRVEVGATAPGRSTGLAGFGRLVHGGDVGDTYNWCPPDNDVEIDAPGAVAVASASSRVRFGPGSASRRRTAGPNATVAPLVDVDVTTTLELHGRRAARASATRRGTTAAATNACACVFPLPAAAEASHAECVVRDRRTRPRPPRAARPRLALPTYPSKRFVQAGGLTVVHDGVLEYELVDIHDGRAHALAAHAGSLHRLAVAGSDDHPAASRRAARRRWRARSSRSRSRRRTRSTSVTPTRTRWRTTCSCPLRHPHDQRRGGRRARDGQALDVDGAVVSSLRRVAGRLEVRVFNPSDDIDHGHDRQPLAAGWSTCAAVPSSRSTGAFELEPVAHRHRRPRR